MAKTLLEFENEMLDVMSIFRITKREVWDNKTGEMKFNIIFNEAFPDKFFIKDLTFSFHSSEFREKKMTELKNKISQLEHINIL